MDTTSSPQNGVGPVPSDGAAVTAHEQVSETQPDTSQQDEDARRQERVDTQRGNSAYGAGKPTTTSLERAQGSGPDRGPSRPEHAARGARGEHLVRSSLVTPERVKLDEAGRRRRLWLDEAEMTLRERGFEVTPDVRSDLAYYHDEERPQEWRQAERDERELEERDDRELAALMGRLRERHSARPSSDLSANGEQATNGA